MQHVNSEKAELIAKVLAKVVRAKRESMGKSQRMLADEFDFPRSLLSRLENGINEPKLVSVWTISEALQMKTSKLIELVENELPDNFSFVEK